METTAEVQNDYGVDQLLADMKKPTEREAQPAEQQPEPQPATPVSDQPSKAEAKTKSEAAAAVVVGTVDVIVNVACQIISGEQNPELFQITPAQKKQIQEPIAELIELYNWKFPPELMLLLAIGAIYAVPMSTAISIRNKKSKIAKATEAPINVEAKRGPGRPTKAQQKLQQLDEDLAKATGKK